MCCWWVFCLTTYAERFNFTLHTFPQQRMLGSKEMSKSGLILWNKREQSGAYTEYFNMFETLQWTQLHLLLHLCWQVTNKPIVPRLKRDEISTTAVPSSPCRSSPAITTLTEVQICSWLLNDVTQNFLKIVTLNFKFLPIAVCRHCLFRVETSL